uniref:Uncharacterized protein n=1 Tax=Anguilla anguilla TaxID=7936 RepID=A0A0E9RZ28_ANGAN
MCNLSKMDIWPKTNVYA